MARFKFPNPCLVALTILVSAARGYLNREALFFVPRKSSVSVFEKAPRQLQSKKPINVRKLSSVSRNGVLVDAICKLQHQYGFRGSSFIFFIAMLTTPLTINIQPVPPNRGMAISINRSKASAAMTENQQFVSDVWWAVTTQYFDQSFNGLGEEGWRAKKKDAIQAVADAGPEDEKVVSEAIQNMLSALGDPYTRYLPREKLEALTAYATGGTAGIGVQLLENSQTKLVEVISALPGSPAAKAGIGPGDIILEVNGESMEDTTADITAAACRGAPGGEVEVLIQHSTQEGAKPLIERVHLTRAKVELNPVDAATFLASSGKRVGLLKVSSFSTETVKQVVDGLRFVRSNGAQVIAIDLRGNVGGYMPAGVDVANLFLPPRAHIIAEVDRSGFFKAYDADGIGAETAVPIYLLVDSRTASAAEIFAAALQDNKRAVVVGTTKTFGKGRIQNVQPLENGCGVAVTKARYVTPSGRDLHGVGIMPDKKPTKCESNDSALVCLADIIV